LLLLLVTVAVVAGISCILYFVGERSRAARFKQRETTVNEQTNDSEASRTKKRPLLRCRRRRKAFTAAAEATSTTAAPAAALQEYVKQNKEVQRAEEREIESEFGSQSKLLTTRDALSVCN